MKVRERWGCLRGLVGEKGRTMDVVRDDVRSEVKSSLLEEGTGKLWPSTAIGCIVGKGLRVKLCNICLEAEVLLAWGSQAPSHLRRLARVARNQCCRAQLSLPF